MVQIVWHITETQKHLSQRNNRDYLWRNFFVIRPNKLLMYPLIHTFGRRLCLAWHPMPNGFLPNKSLTGANSDRKPTKHKAIKSTFSTQFFSFHLIMTNHVRTECRTNSPFNCPRTQYYNLQQSKYFFSFTLIYTYIIMLCLELIKPNKRDNNICKLKDWIKIMNFVRMYIF